MTDSDQGSDNGLRDDDDEEGDDEVQKQQVQRGAKDAQKVKKHTSQADS